MRRSHRIIFYLITVLALATFLFGVLELFWAHHQERPVAGERYGAMGSTK